MADLKHRIKQLQRLVERRIGPRLPCRTCQGQDLFVFDDDPENLWPYCATGLCAACGTLPPDRIDIRLSRHHPQLADIFRGVPFSADPCPRKLARLSLLLSVGNRNEREAEMLLTRIYERDATKRAAESMDVAAEAAKG